MAKKIAWPLAVLCAYSEFGSIRTHSRNAFKLQVHLQHKCTEIVADRIETTATSQPANGRNNILFFVVFGNVKCSLCSECGSRLIHKSVQYARYLVSAVPMNSTNSNKSHWNWLEPVFSGAQLHVMNSFIRLIIYGYSDRNIHTLSLSMF